VSKKKPIYRPPLPTACNTKQKYERKEIADWFLREGMSSYECPVCGYWHIGHKREEK
jgi:predicted RNA-binding Zn-ribbon protein involved in translation (DUF1610 family)